MNNNDTLPTTLILAGGEGRRMHTESEVHEVHSAPSKPKALRTLGGKTLIQHIIEQLAPCSSKIFISCNKNEANHFKHLGLPLIFDPIDNTLSGPLTGIRQFTSYCDTAYALICPCDTPFVSTQLMINLLKTLLNDELAEVCYPVVSEQSHYLLMAIRQSALNTVVEPSNQSLYAVKKWLKTLASVQLSTNIDEKSVFNINSPHDMAIAEQLLRQT